MPFSNANSTWLQLVLCFSILGFTLTGCDKPRKRSANNSEEPEKTKEGVKEQPKASLADSWKVVSIHDSKAEVRFPGTPMKSNQRVQSPKGVLYMHQLIYDMPESNAVLIYTHVDYPDEFFKEVSLEIAIQNFLSTMDTPKIVSDEKFQVAEYTGREVRFTGMSEGNIANGVMRVVLVGKRLYQLVAVTESGGAEREDFETFMNSLKILQD